MERMVEARDENENEEEGAVFGCLYSTNFPYTK